ncbi:TerD family protein [Methylomusa anaerophila]|nr:tellurium resistance protein [Methylomusa anaerophila]
MEKKPQAAATPTAKINLSKSGDSHTIDLTKKSSEILVNLNWRTTLEKKNFFGMLSKESIDLDLGCMYKLTDGSRGVIQALGNSFGSVRSHPFIGLDKDDRTGTSADGENLRFAKPELLAFVVVFAFIYEGAPNWGAAKGVVTVSQQGSPDIALQLDNPQNGKIMCGLVAIENKAGNLVITKLEKYYDGHRQLDKDFGFGFNWTAGSKN